MNSPSLLLFVSFRRIGPFNKRYESVIEKVKRMKTSVEILVEHTFLSPPNFNPSSSLTRSITAT